MHHATPVAALAVAALFAMNIGASGTAASMGVPYGGGAIKTRRTALWLAAACALAGAALGGRAVVATIAHGLVNPEGVTPTLVIVVLGSACVTLMLANLLGIPLSTSEVTVGSVVGMGLVVQGVYVERTALVIAAWVVLPTLSFAAAAGARRWLLPYVEMLLAARRNKGVIRKVVAALLLFSGCYEAFSAGMNNVANAIGPLQSIDLFDTHRSILLGGVCLGLGALAMGGRVLETNAKRITRLSLLEAALVSLCGGSLVVLASLAGIPVPLTQTTTVGIMGIGWAKKDPRAVNRETVSRILRVWVFSPVASLFLSMGATYVALGATTWPEIGSAAGWISASLALLVAQSIGVAKGRAERPQESALAQGDN